MVLLRIEGKTDKFTQFVDAIVAKDLDNAKCIDLMVHMIQQQMNNKMMPQWLSTAHKLKIEWIESLESKMVNMKQFQKETKMKKLLKYVSEVKLFDGETILFGTVNFVLSGISANQLSFQQRKFASRSCQFKLLKHIESSAARHLQKSIESQGIIGCIGIYPNSLQAMSRYMTTKQSRRYISNS